MIEKKTALKWIKAGVETPSFEAPGYSHDEDKQPEPIALKGAPAAGGGGGAQEAVVPAGAGTAVHRPAPADRVRVVFPQRSDVWTTVEKGRDEFPTQGTVERGADELTLGLVGGSGLTSLGARLVFLSRTTSTFFASPPAGWATDQFGAEWNCFAGVVLAIPAFS